MYLLHNTLTESYSQKSPQEFWSLVNKLTKPRSSKCVVNGVCDVNDIANLWASKLQGLLNTHGSSSHHTLLQSLLSLDHLSTVRVSIDDVLNAIHLIKPRKADSARLLSERLRYLQSSGRSSADILAFKVLCTLHCCSSICFFHRCIRDCTLVSIAKILRAVKTTEQLQLHPF